METIAVDHVLQLIAIVVSITAAIIGFTCALALRWINGMVESVRELKNEFKSFVELYYSRHEEVVKKEECHRMHAVLDNKVDRLHERLDEIELDRR